ncbi:MAG: HEAT repeat domain-containing protein [Candidatus Zixiibacteriota bacterium]|nr:HEAT repeat domain-containing protein [candidate division Zixibacteria bacterium]
MTYTVDELRSMQLSGNFKGLLLALTAPDAFVRAEAMSRLTRFQNEAVLEAAIRFLESDNDFNVRSQACVVLRNFPHREESVDALREALRDTHRLVRSKASFALAQLRARDALDDVLAMSAEGLEPDIADTVNTSIEILSTPDKSETLLKLAGDADVEGIGKLFDCMLKPDHEEIEAGLTSKGKNRMLSVFREWESDGRLTALDADPDKYRTARKVYAEKLIDAF